MLIIYKHFYCTKNTKANPENSSLKVLLSVCLLVYFEAEVFGENLRPLLGSAFLAGAVALPVTTN